MKASCIILSVAIVISIAAVCIMVKFATDITVEERKRELRSFGGEVIHFAKPMGVINLKDNISIPIAERFPYVAAVTRNSTNFWSFTCFASIVLSKWVVTSAHCRRAATTHRVLLFQDFAHNFTHTYPILFWRLHEKYNVSSSSLLFDIAVAKLKVDIYPYTIRTSSYFDEYAVDEVESALWKTVSTMDQKFYLTNDFDRLDVYVTSLTRCFQNYAIESQDYSLICIDMSDYEDCFIHEFGPLYFGDKLVGILTMKPRDCELKLAVFTNVSFYTSWILKSTHTTYYG